MFNTLKLRALHALHMAVPLALASWHLDKLRPQTLVALATLFGKS